MRGDGVRRCGVEDCVVGIKDRGGGAKVEKKGSERRGNIALGGMRRVGSIGLVR